MNILKLDIKQEITFEKTELWLNLKIDGKRFLENTNAAFFDELENSLNGNGKFLIFTCSCGVADCAGWEKVIVKHESEKVIWEFKYDNTEFRFDFNFVDYKSEIEKIRLEINQNEIQLQPDFIIYPEP